MYEKNKILELIKLFNLVEGNLEEIDEENGMYLYSCYKSNKRYFLTFNNGDSLNSHLKRSETYVLAKTSKKIVPQDAYLIIFNKVDRINEEVYKEVIDIEENEFLFKKYVFYYTYDELDDAWRKKEDYVNKGYVNNDIKLKDSKNIGIEFLLRLIVKVPMIKLSFNIEKLQEFNSIFNQKLNKLRTYDIEEISNIDNEIQLQMDSIEFENEEKIAINFLEEIYGDDYSEYLSR